MQWLQKLRASAVTACVLCSAVLPLHPGECQTEIAVWSVHATALPVAHSSVYHDLCGRVVCSTCVQHDCAAHTSGVQYDCTVPLDLLAGQDTVSQRLLCTYVCLMPSRVPPFTSLCLGSLQEQSSLLHFVSSRAAMTGKRQGAWLP